jgi:glucokinase
MLLAGDLGGTKTLLGLFHAGAPRPRPVAVTTFVTAEYTTLVHMVVRFLEANGHPRIEAAGFGAAGPVADGRAVLTNVGWAVAASEIAETFRIPSVSIVNDLQAMAYSVPVLERRELAVLQAGRPDAGGNMALIAAGTGLGEALLHRVDGRLIPSPSEGGHADFSPRTADEVRLMELLTSMYGRAEWEQVLSGPGLVNIHRLTHPDGCEVCDPAVDRPLAPSLISRAALENRCPQCVRALEMFVAAYGAEAGNLALRSLATGGVFLGGGIAPKILTALQRPAFLEAFRGKPPMAALLDAIPVAIILNDQAALLGAAVVANAACK